MYFPMILYHGRCTRKIMSWILFTEWYLNHVLGFNYVQVCQTHLNNVTKSMHGRLKLETKMNLMSKIGENLMRMLVFLRVSHEPLKPRKSLGFTWCLVEWGIPYTKTQTKVAYGDITTCRLSFRLLTKTDHNLPLLVCFGYNSIIQSKFLLYSSNSKL